MEEEDRKREAAIASAACLQPNYNSKKGLNSAQISKFQLCGSSAYPSCCIKDLHSHIIELKDLASVWMVVSHGMELHRRRLKIKAKSKVKDKSKGTLVETENYNVKDVYAKCKEIMDEKLIKTAEDPRITTADLSSSQEDNTVSKKRQKLHWGILYVLMKHVFYLLQARHQGAMGKEIQHVEISWNAASMLDSSKEDSVVDLF
ncbi:putative plastidic glucose transporter 4 [Capsicum annuum]|nr:putative plastidic glucose transporter 4 [Capsicum annuum]